MNNKDSENIRYGLEAIGQGLAWAGWGIAFGLIILSAAISTHH